MDFCKASTLKGAVGVKMHSCEIFLVFNCISDDCVKNLVLRSYRFRFGIVSLVWQL